MANEYEMADAIRDIEQQRRDIAALREAGEEIARLLSDMHEFPYYEGRFMDADEKVEAALANWRKVAGTRSDKGD